MLVLEKRKELLKVILKNVDKEFILIFFFKNIVYIFITN